MGGGRDYVCKGDAFSRLVREGAGPLSVQKCKHPKTGRDYFKRVSVSECFAMTYSGIRPLLRTYIAANLMDANGQERSCADLWTELASSWRVMWWLGTDTQELVRADMPCCGDGPGLVEFMTTGIERAGRGARLWFRCSLCKGRCRVVYSSPWGDKGQVIPYSLVGCRRCLGLSDESRQRHNTRAWGEAVWRIRPFERAGFYQVRSDNTKDRAFQVQMKFHNRMARVLQALEAELYSVPKPYKSR